MSDWISIKDKLPPTENMILVYSDKGNILCVHRDYNEWCLQECEYGKDSFFTGEGVKFTHWMPLPEPPKKENEGIS